jgi:2-keto-4-pentenoate hydratase/2-oxohepta-3-ene-1,7-dioic acid hydratase in catechol pathway
MHEYSYRLATYLDSTDQPRAGIVVDDQMLDVSDTLDAVAVTKPLGTATSVLGILQRWFEFHPLLRQIASQVRSREIVVESLLLSATRLQAPVLYPGTVFCAGANYRDHVAEMAKALNLPVESDPHELGLKPWHFIKASVACVAAPNSRLTLPRYSKCVDWEAEIAIVIGRECRDVSVERALDYVAGLSIVNDLSARDHVRRKGVPVESPFHFDWVGQKSFDGALPFGPWICPLDDVRDPGDLKIQLWVNEQLMQDSSSKNMIFSMAEQISHLSTRLTLRPGDVIATGTPAGCGVARGRYLKCGDRVRIWIEDIGELTNDFSD